MKKLVLKIFSFIALFFALIVITYTIIFFAQRNEKIKIPKSNIIIGDSNTKDAINDSIFKNFSNYSTGGESYLFASTKLNLLSKNNKIDTLLLAFSPHNIVNNGWMTFDKGNSPIRSRMSEFFQDFTLEDHERMLKTIPFSYIKSIKFIGKNKIENLFSSKKNEGFRRFGAYAPIKENSEDEEEKNDNIPFNIKYPKAQITAYEIEYLNKIIKTCKDKNIKLILICTPKNYRSKEYAYYNYKEFRDYYYKNYSDIDYLDFSELKLPKDDYRDVSHVLEKGAMFFSKYLQKNGLKNLLQSSYNLKIDK